MLTPQRRGRGRRAASRTVLKWHLGTLPVMSPSPTGPCGKLCVFRECRIDVSPAEPQPGAVPAASSLI